MKQRRPVPPLFAGLEPPTYVIDSSAWFDFKDLADEESAWKIVLRLIEQERLCMPVELVDEIRIDESVWTRLHSHENKFKAPSGEKYFLLAGVIASEFPRMSRFRTRKTKADPMLIAFAELEKFVVVANENVNRNPNSKIPMACKKRGVKCITLNEMLEAENG